MPQETAEQDEKFEVIPPEIQYMSARYKLSVPITSKYLKNPWKLRLYAAKLVERKIGDQVQLTSMKVRKPGALARAKAKLRHEIPNVHLYVTIKF